MIKLNPAVDKFLIDGCMRCKLGATPACKVNNWREELEILRQILLESELTEDLKWGVPCYTLNNKNVIMLSALKESCVISFLKGSLMADSAGILQKPGENSQTARLIRFTDSGSVLKLADVLKSYIQEAVDIERSGKKASVSRNPEPLPEELESALNEDAELKSAFFALTPGRQRGYIIYISQPKQAQSRLNRIEKCRDKILNGEGLNDKYSDR
jgi:uncharacterized protein YdeI (YjbR/CyaY-like superfamily)